MEMRSVLVTGGAGFIGSNFVRLAREQSDARIVVLDALTYAGNLANIKDVLDGERVVFVRHNICDEEVVSDLFKVHDFDTVFHFAAESHVDRSILGPQAFLETNVFGSFTLLQAARKAWEGCQDGRRFLHVSTDEVFGSLEPDEAPFCETSPYHPTNPYSSSKAASDHLVRAWHLTYGLPVLISNCSNNYGPWQFPEKLIPLMILNAVEGRELPIYGDGRQVRDWLHVEDHCEALLAIIRKGEIGHTYCVGGNHEQANIDIVQQICEVVDARLEREPGTAQRLIRHVEDRPGHDRRYAIDASKLSEDLGWAPKRNLYSELPEIVDWYLTHMDWVDNIRSGAYTAFYEEQYGERLRSEP